jgi:hypothetical protein
VLLGPILGVFAIIGIAAAVVLVDPRVRFASALAIIDVPLLAQVPHISTSLTKRVRKSDFILVVCLYLGILASYVGLAAAFSLGYVG